MRCLHEHDTIPCLGQTFDKFFGSIRKDIHILCPSVQHHNHTQAISRIRIGHVFFGHRRCRCRCRRRGKGTLHRSSRTRRCGTCSSSCCDCWSASGLWSKHQTTRRRRRRRRSTRIVHYLFFRGTGIAKLGRRWTVNSNAPSPSSPASSRPQPSLFILCVCCLFVDDFCEIFQI